MTATLKGASQLQLGLLLCLLPGKSVGRAGDL